MSSGWLELHQRPRGSHPRARTTELHPEVRLDGWTCTSDHVGVSYELLLLSYIENNVSARSHAVPRRIERLQSDCVEDVASRAGSNHSSVLASRVPDGPAAGPRVAPPRGLEPQPSEVEAPRSILERWQSLEVKQSGWLDLHQRPSG